MMHAYTVHTIHFEFYSLYEQQINKRNDEESKLKGKNNNKEKTNKQNKRQLMYTAGNY